MDTGASHSLVQPEVERFMDNKVKSKMQIQVANKETMHGRYDGNIIMNTTGSIVQERVTSAKNLPQNLYSIDKKFYEEGFSLIINQPDFTTPCEWCGMSTKIGQPRLENSKTAACIPIETDQQGGGFWVDYWMEYPNNSESTPKHAFKAGDQQCDDYNSAQAMAMVARCVDHGGIVGFTQGLTDFNDHVYTATAYVGTRGQVRKANKANKRVTFGDVTDMERDTPGHNGGNSKSGFTGSVLAP